MTDADILALARRHLDHGLCFDRAAHITRCTDAELLVFGRAIAAEGKELRALLLEWEDGMYEGRDFLRRVRLALHRGEGFQVVTVT